MSFLFMVLFIFILSYLLLYCERQMNGNIGCDRNGIGSLDLILSGKAHMPSQYRIFVPWLCKIFGIRSGEFKVIGMPANRWALVDGGEYLSKWYLLKWASMVFMFFSFYFYLYVLSVDYFIGLLLLMVYLPSTFLYDYTDCYFELGFFALFMAFIIIEVYPFILFLLVLLSFLNRETSIFMPVISYIYNQEIFLSLLLLMACVGGFLIPRLIYGFKERRYRKFVVFEYILENILNSYFSKERLRKVIMFNEYNLALIFLIIFAISFVMSFLYSPSWMFNLSILMGVFVFAIMIPGDPREVRIFYPALITVIPSFLYFLEANGY